MGQSSDIDLVSCRKWIAAALEYNGGTHTIDDIFQGIERGRLHLWPAERGCLVTEFVHYPRKRVINVFLGGGDMDQLKDMHDAIVQFGKANGCTAATISGRPGWARVWRSEGFTPQHLTLVKEI